MQGREVEATAQPTSQVQGAWRHQVKPWTSQGKAENKCMLSPAAAGLSPSSEDVGTEIRKLPKNFTSSPQTVETSPPLAYCFIRLRGPTPATSIIWAFEKSKSSNHSNGTEGFPYNAQRQ